MGVGIQGFWKDHLRGKPYHIRYVPLRLQLRKELVIRLHKLSKFVVFVSYSCLERDMGPCCSFSMVHGTLFSAIMVSSCVVRYHGSAFPRIMFLITTTLF